MSDSQTESSQRDERPDGALQPTPDADERLRRAAGILARAALRASLVQADGDDGGGATDEV